MLVRMVRLMPDLSGVRLTTVSDRSCRHYAFMILLPVSDADLVVAKLVTLNSSTAHLSSRLDALPDTQCQLYHYMPLAVTSPASNLTYPAPASPSIDPPTRDLRGGDGTPMGF